MVSLIAIDNRTFKAVVKIAPAMIDASDAEKVVIPMMMLASKDETKEDVSKNQAVLKVRSTLGCLRIKCTAS